LQEDLQEEQLPVEGLLHLFVGAGIDAPACDFTGTYVKYPFHHSENNAIPKNIVGTRRIAPVISGPRNTQRM
jgi:hypothetical protein